MSATVDGTTEKFDGRTRLLVAALAMGLAVPLFVVRVLTPDQRGYGTHQQLGLPPCTFVVLFGQRCPTCGGTTAWAHLVRGRLSEAVRANVGGTLLGVLDLVAVPWLLLSASCGRWLGWKPGAAAVGWLALVVLAVMLVDWGVRLLAG